VGDDSVAEFVVGVGVAKDGIVFARDGVLWAMKGSNWHGCRRDGEEGRDG
jgi:sulfur transfer complex TusBCD TusB component (DsrH family)